ncbi:glutaredoxin-like protein C5orf63 homolog isoform X4 [Rhinatrema bivittatum]|uniref:glutaredoxin-like protein C5orf63 homolog isoform X4 n=1 Tax=Rhinatrema bivittatum TaxID=194408 RepID=UPI001128D35E|nr:glutaredoxin-like protein C5orf63 homolog isoform X4 [Rhinatrema bivittatum]
MEQALVRMLWLLGRTWQQQLVKHYAGPLMKRPCSSNKDIPILTLFTKFVLQEVDITLPENAIWFDRYKHDIPVFHLNGQFLMMHRVNCRKLEKQLSRLEQAHEGR